MCFVYNLNILSFNVQITHCFWLFERNEGQSNLITIYTLDMGSNTFVFEIGEETLEMSCRSTTCPVRTQKHDYSWYDNTPDTETVASIHEVYHTAAGLWSNRTDDKSNSEDTGQQACARLTSNQRRFPGTHKRHHIAEAKVERCACVETTKWSLVQCCFTNASVT